jgi:adenylylsulfate kinase
MNTRNWRVAQTNMRNESRNVPHSPGTRAPAPPSRKGNVFAPAERVREPMASAPPPPIHGFVAWIEGIPGSGKSTLSRLVSQRLRAAGYRVEVLDGDDARAMFSPELGYSRKDREFHARRVSYVARLLARNGVAVLVAMITPYETSRQAARAVASDHFSEIWLDCPVAVCRKRDPKGVYKRSGEGNLKKLTGVDDPFEEPLNPDLRIDTSTDPPEVGAEAILGHLGKRGFLAVPVP